jgi:hypothetical protein
MAIWRMRFACWIIKTTDTHSVFNTYCFSTSTVVTRTRPNVSLYIHCLSCLLLYRSTVAVIRWTNTCWVKKGYCCAAVCEWIIAAIRRRTAVPSKHIRPNPWALCVSVVASLALMLTLGWCKCVEILETRCSYVESNPKAQCYPSCITIFVTKRNLHYFHTHIYIWALCMILKINSNDFLEEHKVTVWSC